MNTIHRPISAAVILSVFLSACSENTPPEISSGDTSPASLSMRETVTENESENAAENCVPVISINSQPGSLDFVTKPVARHVSESIATWTPHYKMPPEPYYEKCTVTVTDTDGSVAVDSVGAQVKVRGNWTTSYDKKPLRIKFDEKQSMPGLSGGKQFRNWVLLAQYKDGSMLRDKTALQIARGLLGRDGLYTSDARFAEVYINGQYWGMYLLTEFQQVNEDRVDITENPTDYTGTDIGYFMEFDGYFYNEDDLHSFHPDYENNAPLVPYDGNGGSGRTMKCLGGNKSDIGITIKSDINTREQHDFIENYVNNVYKIMYSAAYENKAFVFNDDFSDIYETSDISPYEAVEAAVDLDSLADIYIVNEIACDADVYWSSFFMDADFGENGDKRLHFEAAWDFDSSMGLKDRCADSTGFYAANIVPDVNGFYETINPWLAVMIYNDNFRELISEKWTDAYDSGVFENALDTIKSDTSEFADAFDRNYQKWNNIIDNHAIAGELCDAAKRCRTHAETSEYLYNWLSKRIEFLNGYFHK